MQMQQGMVSFVQQSPGALAARLPLQACRGDWEVAAGVRGF